MKITYTVDCHCGQAAEMSVWHAGMDPADIRIDVELTLGQPTFDCSTCGCSYGSGDLEFWTEGDCPGWDADEDYEDEDEVVPA